MSTHSSRHWNHSSSWLVLAVGLTLVGAATLHMKATVERDAKREFDSRCNEIQNRITERLYNHARILRSGVAFFNASDNVTREEFRVYTKLQKIEQTLPGIQGIGFSLLIQPAERARHIQDVRSEGFPEYLVKPAGDRELYSAIIYLEPFDARNQRAFGYDMFSEPVRRAAMERARDEDSATLSGKVLLVQEMDEDVQAGMLMYVPVYRNGMLTDSVEQRRAALRGWVYSPYRMTDLMRGIFGDRNLKKELSLHLHLQIFDGAQPQPQTLIYQSYSAASGPRDSKEQFNELLPIDFNGHRWTLHFVQHGGGLFTAQYMEAWFILSGGTLIAFLLFGLIRTLYIRAEAQQLTQELAVDLRDERYRLSSIIHGTDAGTWEWNIQTGEVVFNDKWAQIIGYTLDELAPVTIKTWDALTHPDDLKRSKELLKKHYSGERPFYDCECRMKHKDGHWVWIHDRGQVLTRTGDGQPLMMFGTHTEITERKQAEDHIARLLEESNQAKTALLGIVEDEARARVALQASEEMMRSSQAVAHICSYSTHLNENKLEESQWVCSPEFYKIFGIDETYPHTIAGWVKFIHPDFRDEMFAYHESVVTERKSFNKEYQIIRINDGAERWVQGTGELELDEEGNPIRMHGAIQDITERKQAEAEKERLMAAINQAAEIIVITDVEGTIEYVNPAFERGSGYTCEEAIGQNPRILQSGEHDEAFYASIWETISSGRTWEGRIVNARKDGSHYTEEATISPVSDSKGEIINYVAVKRDITHELAQEEGLRQSQKMEAVGQLAGGVAHDFNNILQGILGFSEMLRFDLDETSQAYDQANEIHNAAQRAAELTRQLLTFSRKEPVQFEETDLNDVIHDSEALLTVLLSEKHQLVLDLSDDLPPIHSDSSQLIQVIMNLTVNARDAMPDGGRLSISTDKVTLDETDAAYVSGARRGHFLCLAVTDTGFGMDEQTQKRVFEPFFTTKEIGAGTGLGLAVIYGIVEQNQGWINVYSEIGKGTSIKIYLPVMVAYESDAEAGTDPAAHAGIARILLIEDDPEIRHMVEEILGGSGYRVVPAASAEEGLNLYHQEEGRFDLLMSDMELPGMRGDALADALRCLNPELPVLLFSGYRDHAERWKHLADKGYLFMSKPFTLVILLDTVICLLKDKK